MIVSFRHSLLEVASRSSTNNIWVIALYAEIYKILIEIKLIPVLSPHCKDLISDKTGPGTYDPSVSRIDFAPENRSGLDFPPDNVFRFQKSLFCSISSTLVISRPGNGLFDWE